MDSATTPFIGVHHVGLRAQDVDTLVDFYRAAGGLLPWPALDGLALPGGGVALAGPNAGLRILPGGGRPQHRAVSEAGITHVCLQSPDIAGLHRRFAGAGAQFHSPLVDLGTGFLYAYARDGEYNVVELEGVAPVWADPQPWLAHVNIACADIGRQADFYAALLGAPAVRSPRLQGDARLDQIAGLRGVALRMAWVPAGNQQVELIHYSQPAAHASSAPSTRRGDAAAGHCYIAFEVNDLAAATARLQHSGGQVDAVQAYSGLHTGRDPEGNGLWLLDSRALQAHGAAIAQLPRPRITREFAAARMPQQGRGS